MTLLNKGKALITGASTGIGAIYANRLAKQGYDIIIVARNQELLEKQAYKITQETGRLVEILVADLITHEGMLKVEKKLAQDKDITVLVNNAGIGGVMPLLNSDVNEMDKMITLNITALTRLTYAVVPQFVEKAKGTIINIGSIVAIAPEILNGVYGASKAYVLSFSHSLQHELADKGIRIQAVLPGAISTDFWSIAGNPVENLPQEIVMSADDLVDAALMGLEKGELVTIPGLHEGDKWMNFENSRKEISTLLSASTPAPRYLAR
ncbi:SDR family oxidoreductase [Acinetobacter baumannii]|uniref:SDR family NAD(P)-dependent oxidoreductase n=1 Tax=Acinetobacter calcoaceticus/baumannii complex TaxID=909768 RepID=UPI000838BC0E|nr:MULTISPECIES: SDR family oxidoreductase [Acinetobacter calcoaceticus/baumannii complex]MDH2526511.1 SDR family oxidoreductase [Acinetobacter baumannii]MDV7432862.1 SDR family oxidoreductase [Acinetobacter baumannii]OCY54577.1 SDR family oxidoreductase [Acinetobacter pittii]HCW3749189.1 SDR family oxidoreductase [Acinetobacter baumannii]